MINDNLTNLSGAEDCLVVDSCSDLDSIFEWINICLQNPQLFHEDSDTLAEIYGEHPHSISLNCIPSNHLNNSAILSNSQNDPDIIEQNH